MGRFEWTPEADASLAKFLGEGLSMAEIAARMGLPSRNAVCGRVMRLRDKGKLDAPRSLAASKPISKLVGKPRSPGLAHVPLIKERLQAGFTDREIAAEIGIHAEDVLYARRINNLPATVRPAGPPANADEVAKLVADGKSDPEIADELGITVWQARHTRRRLNLGKPAAPKQQAVTNIVKGDSGDKIGKVFAEGFMGQRSRLGLLDMPRNGACRFPIDQADGSVRYCGDHAADGEAYCAHHAARCYIAAPPAKPLKPSHVYTARR